MSDSPEVTLVPPCTSGLDTVVRAAFTTSHRLPLKQFELNLHDWLV